MKNKEYMIIFALVVAGALVANYVQDKYISHNITKV